MRKKNVHSFLTWTQAGKSPLKHFGTKEFEYPQNMDDATLAELGHMREEEGRHQDIIMTINSDFRPGDEGSHGEGLALDLVIKDKLTKKPLPVLEQFFIASRYAWRGIGMYPHWSTPGIHVDLQGNAISRRRLWWRDFTGTYRTMKDFVFTYIGMSR